MYKVKTFELFSIEGFEFKNLPAGNKANEYGFYQGSMSNHDKVYENIVDVLSKGSTVSASFFDGLKTVEIIDEIYRSAQGLNE